MTARATPKHGRSTIQTAMAVAVAAIFAPLDHLSAQHDLYTRMTIGLLSGSTMDNSWNAARGNRSGKLSAESGALYTIAVGYRRDQWRAEVERFWTDQYVSGPVAPLEAGVDTSYVYNLATRSWFANLYRVLAMRGRLAPHAGLGFGVVQASIDYQVGTQVPRDRTNEALVCLITFLVACGWGDDRGTFHDEIVGYRLFGGADYVFDRFAIALTLGWMGMVGLEGQDQARNEAWYGVATDHLLSFYGSFGVSYRFRRWW